MLPHFLYAGPPKTGSTWLFANLRLHPGVWFPVVKELAYFNNQPPQSLPKLVLGGNKDSIAWRKAVKKRWRKFFERRQHEPAATFGDLLWDVRFSFFPRNDHWYSNLFTPGAGQITGDITPAYGRLSETTIARISKLIPEIRVIIIVRDPISRSWSHAAWETHERGLPALEALESLEIKNLLTGSHVSRQSDYMKTIGLWERFLPEQQIHVEFFDRLAEDSRGVYLDVCRFLGLDDRDEIVPESIHKRHNEREYMAMSDEFGALLAEKHLPQIRRLDERFHNKYTAAWLESAARYLSANGPSDK